MNAAPEKLPHSVTAAGDAYILLLIFHEVTSHDSQIEFYIDSSPSSAVTFCVFLIYKIVDLPRRPEDETKNYKFFFSLCFPPTPQVKVSSRSPVCLLLEVSSTSTFIVRLTIVPCLRYGVFFDLIIQTSLR